MSGAWYSLHLIDNPLQQMGKKSITLEIRMRFSLENLKLVAWLRVTFQNPDLPKQEHYDS